MRIACVSHYSPRIKNIQNSWIADFYSESNDLLEINDIYFFHISYSNNLTSQISEFRLNSKYVDVLIRLPMYIKYLRHIKIIDGYVTAKINKLIVWYLSNLKFEFDIVHINTLYYSFMFEAFSFFKRSKLILHLHENEKLLQTILSSNRYSAYKYINKYTYIIRQTPFRDASLIKYNSNVIFLPNAFSGENFCFSKKEMRIPKNICIVSIGSLRKIKNYNLALHYIKGLKKEGFNIEYHIIGAGKELFALQRVCRKLDITSNVIFHGYKEKDYIFNILKKSNILLNTSYYESFGNVFLESITSGTPILTCARGGPEYLFKWAEKKVYIGEYERNDMYKLINKTKKILNENKQNQMNESSKIVKKEFGSKKFLKSLINIELQENNKYKWWEM